jgi:hypothetical protein
MARFLYRSNSGYATVNPLAGVKMLPTELKRYLDDIRTKLRLAPSSEKEIIGELYTHFEERVEELQEEGLSEEEAVKVVTQRFGPAKAIAGEMNQVHTKGNWAQAIVAALPHLLFALLFALHQWHNIAWLCGIFVSILCVVVYGWRRNKPTWLFPWLGYVLVPLLMVSFILLILLAQALPFLPMKNLALSWWVWIAALVYLPIALWVFISIAVQTIKRDWLLVSLMALPLPAIAVWFLVVRQEGGSLGFSRESFQKLESSIALSFLALASVVMLFIRFTQRSLKVGALLTAGFAILAIVAFSSQASLSFFILVALVLISIALLLGPVLLEHKIGHGDYKTDDWDYPGLEQTSSEQASRP